jgi:integrase
MAHRSMVGRSSATVLSSPLLMFFRRRTCGHRNQIAQPRPGQTKGFPRKSEAQHWLDKQTAAIISGTHIAPRDTQPTIEQWCDLWIGGLPERFSFHDLRHYLASLLIASGADIKTVQARMRRATACTTLDTYSHLWPDADESTRSAIGAVIAEQADSSGSTAYPLRTEPAKSSRRRRSTR